MLLSIKGSQTRNRRNASWDYRDEAKSSPGSVVQGGRWGLSLTAFCVVPPPGVSSHHSLARLGSAGLLLLHCCKFTFFSSFVHVLFNF